MTAPEPPAVPDRYQYDLAVLAVRNWAIGITTNPPSPEACATLLAGAVPDTGQARVPEAHPVGGFTHDPGLVALVADQIAETYSDDEYQIRPDPGDVIADVMETVRADIRDRAKDQARCGKIDECAAKALVLARLADWLEGWPSGDTTTGAVQAPDVASEGSDHG